MPKKISDSWFKKWFNTKDYLELYKHRDSRDAAKIVSLINKSVHLPKGSKALDLACGNGRHSVLFAKKGYNVLGIDLSPFLISQAKQRLNTDYARYKNNLEFEIRDMRKISHINEFDLVVNLFSSFGYFDKDSENREVIKSISKNLKPNGYFFFDFLNARTIVKSLVPFDIQKRNHNIIIQVREIKDRFVKKSIIIIRNNPKSRYPLVNNFYEKIKLYSLEDFRKMFKSNRLKIIQTFGDYKGSSFNANKSGRLIILARKI